MGIHSLRKSRTAEEWFRTGIHQHGGFSSYDHPSIGEFWGLYEVGSVVDTTSAAVRDAGGIGLQGNTGAVIGNRAFVADTSGRFKHQRRMNPLMQVKFALVQVTDIRFFAGIASSPQNSINSDTPGATAGVSLIGVQFSTSRPDTNFQVIAADGAGDSIADSGIAATTDPFLVRVQLDDSPAQAIVEIVSNPGVVLSSTIVTARLPATATDMCQMGGLQTLVGVVKSVVSYYQFGEQRVA